MSGQSWQPGYATTEVNRLCWEFQVFCQHTKCLLVPDIIDKDRHTIYIYIFFLSGLWLRFIAVTVIQEALVSSYGEYFVKRWWMWRPSPQSQGWQAVVRDSFFKHLILWVFLRTSSFVVRRLADDSEATYWSVCRYDTRVQFASLSTSHTCYSCFGWPLSLIEFTSASMVNNLAEISIIYYI